ncbi:MAG: PorT family protein [Tannerella sp.]|jgi:hypothetical protein|nr:PorT family protein [Tannerella sp.]
MSIEHHNNVEERDRWDDIIRSKLSDIEEDTNAEDWRAIADRLPAGKKIRFNKRWYYAAAAVVGLFLLISGGYNYFFKEPKEAKVVAVVEKERRPNDESQLIKSEDQTAAPSTKAETNNSPLETSVELSNTGRQSQPVENDNSKDAPSIQQKSRELVASIVNDALSTQPEITHTLDNASTLQEIPLPQSSFQSVPKIDASLPKHQYIADATPVPSRRRWSIGAGGGSYSVGSNNGGMVYGGRAANLSYFSGTVSNSEQYLLTPERRNDYFNRLLTEPSLSSANTAGINSTSITKVGLKHNQPISFGIGVGYALNDRWSLQSGLVYTYLASHWSTVLDYQGESRQQLHFIGIPLSINYKIAEWDKLRFYATAGGMGEINVGGNIKTDYYFYEDESVRTEKEYIRMKELQWSVNARLGATYPLIRFVNAYVEGGADYFFKNKSSIETIRSDKPFHVSLQAGLRFGF